MTNKSNYIENLKRAEFSTFENMHWKLLMWPNMCKDLFSLNHYTWNLSISCHFMFAIKQFNIQKHRNVEQLDVLILLLKMLVNTRLLWFIWETNSSKKLSMLYKLFIEESCMKEEDKE